jgi:hypothetical protein
MFNKTLSELKKKYQKRALYVTTPAAERANELKKFDICIVDPPRKGLDIEVVEALNNNNNNNNESCTYLIFINFEESFIALDCILNLFIIVILYNDPPYHIYFLLNFIIELIIIFLESGCQK